MLLTLAQLRAIAPRAPESALDPLNAAMFGGNIDTPERTAAFVAQVMFECNQGNQLVEAWGPTPAQQRYERNARLGNTEPGDGERFKGRGAIQLTGRANYTLAAAETGLPLVEQPELAADPAYAYTLAAWYWNRHSLSLLADRGDFLGITRAINGGLNGEDVREMFWDRAKQTLGVAP